MTEEYNYVGMSYEQASREATRLIERHGWFQAWGRLEKLRAVLQRGYSTTLGAYVGG